MKANTAIAVNGYLRSLELNPSTPPPQAIHYPEAIQHLERRIRLLTEARDGLLAGLKSAELDRWQPREAS